VVIGDFILFIVTPTAPSLFSALSSDQSGYESSHNEPDSDAFDPDDYPAAASDLSTDGSSSPNEFNSDNVDPDFPEAGYNHS
jgi:hypothetical protein